MKSRITATPPSVFLIADLSDGDRFHFLGAEGAAATELNFGQIERARVRGRDCGRFRTHPDAVAPRSRPYRP